MQSCKCKVVPVLKGSVMKIYVAMEVKLHAFLTLALDGCE